MRNDLADEFLSLYPASHWPAVGGQPAVTMEIGDSNVPIPVAGDAAKLAFFEKYFVRQRPAGTR